MGKIIVEALGAVIAIIGGGRGAKKLWEIVRKISRKVK